MDFFDFPNSGDIVQDIKEMIHCPFCSADYFESDIKIVAKFEDNIVAHLTCKECRNSIMANISFRYGGGAPYEISGNSKKQKFDVPLERMMEYIKKGTITNDEVMDFYNSVKTLGDSFPKFNIIEQKITRGRKPKN